MLLGQGSPSLGRSERYAEDLMSLSTIGQGEFAPKHTVFHRSWSQSLQTDDIDGARPLLRGYQYFHKPEFANRTWDIERAQPMPLVSPEAKTGFSLTTHDIPFARPQNVEFQTKRVGTNPLDPVYKLPSFQMKPATPPKFIRDAHSIEVSATQDIDGAKAKSYLRWKVRETMKIDDIEGSHPKPEKQLRKTNFMDPSDINKEFVFTTKRSVDPLKPEELVTIGPVPGSSPRTLVKTSSEAHVRHLKTDDIEGAVAGTKGLGPFAWKPRSTFRNSIDVSDIDGTQMESLKRGTVTTRCTNPNAPVYQYPGHSEEQQPVEEVKAVPAVEKHYQDNEAKFFGVSPPPSVRSSSDRKASPSSERKPDVTAELNRAKFYGDDSRLQSPTLQAEQLQRDQARFYSNTPPFGRAPAFEEVFRTGSIQLPKPKPSVENLNPAEFHKSAKAFYAASSSHPSRGSVASSQHSNPSDPGRYKFTIPRAEIGTASSRGSSLKSSARQVLEG